MNQHITSYLIQFQTYIHFKHILSQNYPKIQKNQDAEKLPTEKLLKLIKVILSNYNYSQNSPYFSHAIKTLIAFPKFQHLIQQKNIIKIQHISKTIKNQTFYSVIFKILFNDMVIQIQNCTFYVGIECFNKYHTNFMFYQYKQISLNQAIQFVQPSNIVSMLRASMQSINSQSCISSFISNLCNSPANRKQSSPPRIKKENIKFKLSQMRKKYSNPSDGKRSKGIGYSPSTIGTKNLLQKLHQEQLNMELTNLKSPLISKIFSEKQYILQFRSTQKTSKFLSPPPRINPLQRHPLLQSEKGRQEIKYQQSSIPKIKFITKQTSKNQNQPKLELPITHSYPQQQVKPSEQPEYNNQNSNVKTRESYLQNSAASTNKIFSQNQQIKNFIDRPRFTISIAGSSNEDLQESIVISNSTGKQVGSKFLVKLT